MSDPSAKTISVLLVEDSPMDGRLLMEALRSFIAGGEVILQSVKTLGSARGELQKFAFDCVLLDLGLPDGRGTGNVSSLREIDKKAAIVVLTGLDDERSAAEALKLGAQDYLVKGETDGEKLMKLIRRAMQRNTQTVALEIRRDSTFFDASRDPLTLLPNRSLFLDRSRTQLSAARQQTDEFGIGFVILDGLDAFKTNYGSAVTDELIHRLGQLMAEALRVSDTVARVEHNEFAVLLNPSDSHEALRQRMASVRQRLSMVTSIGNCSVELLVKTGTAWHNDHETAEELFTMARDAAEKYSATDTTEPVPGVETAAMNGLTDTTPAGLELVPKWQPWADVSALRWLGLEFVPEWSDGRPVFGQQALSMTEAYELTLAAATALASQCRAWEGETFLQSPVAMQVPAAALLHANFVASLNQIFASHQVSASSVQLEIEESAFKGGADFDLAISRLHSRGYLLCMEGDGSTDISLGQFSRAPVNAFKLSKRFLQSLVEEGMHGPARRLLTAMMGAAQALGASLVGSGVDSQEAVNALRLVGVDFLQGDVLSPALTSDAVAAAMAVKPKSY